VQVATGHNRVRIVPSFRVGYDTALVMPADPLVKQGKSIRINI
jgi:hypothetical protein